MSAPVPGSALRDHVWELARDVGMLRRRFASNEYAWTGVWLCDRIAGRVASIDLMLRPSAAELVAWTYPGDQETIEEAIRLVDDHWSRLQAQMGGRP